MPIFNTFSKLILRHSNMCERSLFVRNARSLETLKNGTITANNYRMGKYLVCVKDTDLILVEPKSRKIAWQTEDVLLPYFKEGEILRIILDVVDQDLESYLFAIDLPLDSSRREEIGNILGGKFFNARKALYHLNEKDAALSSQSQGLINFCRTTNFCRTCGASLETSSAGTQKKCLGCKKVHYPILSPVGIVLIEDETHSKVLLVRGKRHPPGMFSCVAGFVEPGESLEGNIRREIAEEVGVDVGKIEYCDSQHWAMPESQLMLGCIATTTCEEYEIDSAELEAAKWVTSDTLKDAVLRAKIPKAPPTDPEVLWVPPPVAIAHTLMEVWLRRYHGYPALTSRI